MKKRYLRLAALTAGVLLAAQTGLSAAALSTFDAAYYAAQYPDVAAVCGNDEGALLRHYLDHGIDEGRKPSADGIAGDDELSAIYKARGDLAPGALIDLLHGGAGNVHLRGALLVRALLEIDEPDDLILIQRQQNGSRLLMSLRAKGVDLRRIADPPASRWSRHSVTSKAVIFGIYRL